MTIMLTDASRRAFLKGAAAAGLVLGFELPVTGRAGAAAPALVNGFIRIAPDDSITMLVNHAEMGQGVYTSLAMQMAEELEVDWARVRCSEAAPAAQMGLTGGSTSTRESFDRLRKVGAQAREMLRQAAAERWRVPVAECVAAKGEISHRPTGRTLSYGALAEAAAKLAPPAEVALKDPKDWTILGKPTPRLDTPLKVDGSAVFGIDVRLPGMLVGTLAACPVFGGTLKSVDERPALAIKGVHSVVRLESAVVVLADSYYEARKGLAALQPVWDEGPFAGVSTESLGDAYQAALAEPGAPARAEGDAAAMGQAAKVVEATYRVPYLAHATLEPQNATARLNEDGTVEIWAPSQSPGFLLPVLAPLLGVAPDRITIHTTFLGGGFGRRGENDFVVYAAQAAKAAGRPVKLIWSREEDMQHDHYRPAVTVRLKAGLDQAGGPAAFQAKLVLQSIFAVKLPNLPLKGGIDPVAVEGISDMLYGFPSTHVDWVKRTDGAPIGFWRSVGHSHNVYFLESFIDELAHASGQDPVALRRRLLAGNARALKVLDTAAAAAGWGGRLPDGHFQGVAFCEAYDTLVAQVLEISLDQGKTVRVHKVTAAVDCGTAVNPSTVEAQIESGVIYGLTAALYGEITVARGRVTQANFDSYPMLRMAQAPAIAVHIINSGAKIGGIGEPGTPCVAPALANAVFAATGRRVRELPLIKSGLVEA